MLDCIKVLVSSCVHSTTYDLLVEQVPKRHEGAADLDQVALVVEDFADALAQRDGF